MATAACQDALEPDQSIAVGHYALESVAGDGPATGSIVLFPGGQLERRVRFREDDGSLSAEFVGPGTFRLTIRGLEIDMGGWAPPATLRAGVLILEYPDALDGPNIVETYRRTETVSD